MKMVKMDKQGILMCAKYAASPNFFGYCGPNKSSNIIDHLKNNIADHELGNILSEFETLYPYLQLIAMENKILDPFEKRVVEAYWIGNPFLNNIKNIQYLYFLKEKLMLDKKLDDKGFGKIITKIKLLNYLPHHTFHVFNIFRRTGHDSSFQTLSTMNDCRINYGIVVESQISNVKTQNNILNLKTKKNSILVKTNNLQIVNDRLSLGDYFIKEIYVDYKGKGFVGELKTGDWVSFHWGYLCDKLDEKQVKNLEFFTKKAIEYYNL